MFSKAVLSDFPLCFVDGLCSGLFKVENSYFAYDSHFHDPTDMAGTDKEKAIPTIFLSVKFWCISLCCL